jgi:hypothetical protein
MFGIVQERLRSNETVVHSRLGILYGLGLGLLLGPAFMFETATKGLYTAVLAGLLGVVVYQKPPKSAVVSLIGNVITGAVLAAVSYFWLDYSGPVSVLIGVCLIGAYQVGGRILLVPYTDDGLLKISLLRAGQACIWAGVGVCLWVSLAHGLSIGSKTGVILVFSSLPIVLVMAVLGKWLAPKPELPDDPRMRLMRTFSGLKPFPKLEDLYTAEELAAMPSERRVELQELRDGLAAEKEETLRRMSASDD